MFSKLLMGLILIMGITGFTYKMTTDRTIAELKATIATQGSLLVAFETREAEQARTIEAMENNLKKTTEALGTLNTRNAEIENENKRYLSIFARHDLARLASAKPGLIETRINKGTANVFKSIEDDTAIIDTIDD
jgi:uncharacterized coiled-coil protein SlyX